LFSYVDKAVREKLEADTLMVTLNRDSTIVSSEDSSAYMSILGPVPIPRMIGSREVELDWYPFVRRTELSHVWEAARQVVKGGSDAFRELLHSSMSVNSVFALKGFADSDSPLVRLHSCCLTGDVFGSRRCDCGPQLNEAFERIAQEGCGAIVYMSGHEGRGIGLWAKAVTYLLQDHGQNTYEANSALGLPEDSRDFGDAAVLLRYFLKGRPVRLMSNNLDKRTQLERGGQPVLDISPIVAGVCSHNVDYLRSKREKGHLVPDDL